MQGWTLGTVADLDEDVYTELVAWVNEQDAAREGSVDMDAVVDAQRKAQS